MKRNGVLLSTLLTVVLTLTACGSQMVTDQHLQFNLLPDHTLGYEVSDTGEITIATRQMSFRNSPGAMGVRLTGYDVTYYDGDGNAIPAKVSDDDEPFALSGFVPAGLTCDEPDEEYGCTIFDEGWRAAPSRVETLEPQGNLLPIGVAAQHLGDTDPSSSIRWRAEFTFHGYRTDGAAIETAPYAVQIAPPN